MVARPCKASAIAAARTDEVNARKTALHTLLKDASAMIMCTRKIRRARSPIGFCRVQNDIGNKKMKRKNGDWKIYKVASQRDSGGLVAPR